MTCQAPMRKDRHAAACLANQMAFEAVEHVLYDLRAAGAIVGRDNGKVVFYSDMIDSEIVSVLINVYLEATGEGVSATQQVFPEMRGDGSFVFMESRLELFREHPGVEWPYAKDLRDLVREIVPAFPVETKFAMDMFDAKLQALNRNLFGARRPI